MAETMIEGLSGTEIVNDILDQIKRKLQTSCDLRDTDSYGQGFSASIEIKLKIYAMDVISSEFSIEIKPKAEPPVSTEEMLVTPVEVVEKIEIPQELDLEVVRERQKEPEPLPPASEDEEARMPARLKRKYSRRLPSLEQTTAGGAVDLDADEPKF